MFIFRWSQHVRYYDAEYPHYVMLSEEEKAKCERAREQAARRAARKQRPEPLRVQPPRGGASYQDLMDPCPCACK